MDIYLKQSFILLEKLNFYRVTVISNKFSLIYCLSVFYILEYYFIHIILYILEYYFIIQGVSEVLHKNLYAGKTHQIKQKRHIPFYNSY